MLYTIAKVPEELTLHETPMYQSYGIEYVYGDVWEEMDACLTALATKAAEQGHKLRLSFTTGLFSTPHSEDKFRSRLVSFVENGTFSVLHSPAAYSHAKGPF